MGDSNRPKWKSSLPFLAALICACGPLDNRSPGSDRGPASSTSAGSGETVGATSVGSAGTGDSAGAGGGATAGTGGGGGSRPGLDAGMRPKPDATPPPIDASGDPADLIRELVARLKPDEIEAKFRELESMSQPDRKRRARTTPGPPNGSKGGS